MSEKKDLLSQALELRPQDKILLLEGILQSLDEPDKEIDQIWAEEAERRLDSYRTGKMKGIRYDQVFGASDS